MSAPTPDILQNVRLYHGSDVAIERPDISFNTGFADLGKGFYLTDDHEIAKSRAYLRSRRMGSATGAVSIFELDETCVPWATWGVGGPTLLEEDSVTDGPFGLRFDACPEGVAAWTEYIRACRQGKTAIEGIGSPSLVRAWIATEEVEMVCSGFATSEEVAAFLDPARLVVQYCLRDQALIDKALTFVGSEVISF